MKKKIGIVLISCMIIPLYATVFDSVSYLWNYLTPSDPVNIAADKFRKIVQGFYKTAKIAGYGEGYKALKQEYLYPPVDAVPAQVRSQLEKFYNTPVASAGQNYNPETALRNNAELGVHEQQFIKNRLAVVRKQLQKAELDVTFPAPDSNLVNNAKPYGFALDEGLQETANVPRIAVCCSGGGFRAMIATLGLWKGMSDTGIVDSILYSSNLSGSTWCTMPWSLGATLGELEACYSKYATRNMSEIVKHALINVATKAAREKLTMDFLWKQPLSFISGVYAPLIGEMTLSFWADDDLRQQTGTEHPRQSSQYLYLWQALDFIMDGTKRPFPIATALVPYQGNFDQRPEKIVKIQRSKNGIWMEFNPDTVGFEYLKKDGTLSGAWTPTFALGWQFTKEITENKKSRWLSLLSSKKVIGYEAESGPCQTLDGWAGTWGSAFAVSFGDVYRIFMGSNENNNPNSTTGMSVTDNGASIGNRLLGLVTGAMSLDPRVHFMKQATRVRFYPTKFNNFALFDDSPFKGNKTITAVDAGLDFNLPFPPLLRAIRQVDLIITGDFSSEDIPAQELLKAESWARKRGLPFPLIQNSKHFKDVAKQPMTLFNEYPHGTTGPAILYIPLRDNQFNAPDFSVAQCVTATCNTFNFAYGPVVQQLSNHLYRTVWGVYPQIREVVQALVQAKNTNTALTMTSLTPLG